MEKITANFWKAKSAASFRPPLLIFCFQILFWNLIIETVFAEPGCKHKSLLKPFLWCSRLQSYSETIEPLTAVRWRRGKLVCFKKEIACVKGRELTCTWFGGQSNFFPPPRSWVRCLTTGWAGDAGTAVQSILADVGAMELLFGLLKFRFLSIPAVLDQ